MRQLPFSFAVSGDTINSPTVRTVRGHVEQTCAVRDGLCNYRINLWVNEIDDTRHVERTVKGVRYLETPLDVIAWVIALYPEINTVPSPEPEPTPADPILELRKSIEAPSTWRKVFVSQIRPGDVVLWNGGQVTIKDVRKKRGSILMFVFEDGTERPIHKSFELMILSKENETR